MSMRTIIMLASMLGICLVAADSGHRRYSDTSAVTSAQLLTSDTDSNNTELRHLLKMASTYRLFYGDVPDNMALFHPEPRLYTASTSAWDNVDMKRQLVDYRILWTKKSSLWKTSPLAQITDVADKLQLVRFVADLERAFSYRFDPYLQPLLDHIKDQYDSSDEYQFIAKSLWQEFYQWQHFVLLYDKLKEQHCHNILDSFPFNKLPENKKPLVAGLRAWETRRFLQRQFSKVFADGPLGALVPRSGLLWTRFFAPKTYSPQDIIRTALQSGVFRDNPTQTAYKLLTCGIRIPLQEIIPKYGSEYVGTSGLLPLLSDSWKGDYYYEPMLKKLEAVQEISSHPLVVDYFRQSVHFQFLRGGDYSILTKNVLPANIISAQDQKGQCYLHWLFKTGDKQYAPKFLKTVMEDQVYAALRPFANVSAHVLNWCSLVGDQGRDYRTKKLTMDELRRKLPKCLFPRSRIRHQFNAGAFLRLSTPIEVVRKVLQPLMKTAAASLEKVVARSNSLIALRDSGLCARIEAIRSYWRESDYERQLTATFKGCHGGNVLHLIVRCGEYAILRSFLALKPFRELLNKQDDRKNYPFDYMPQHVVTNFLNARVGAIDQQYLQVPPWHPRPDLCSLLPRNRRCKSHSEDFIEDAALAALFQSSPRRFRHVLETFSAEAAADSDKVNPFMYHIDLIPQVVEAPKAEQ